MGGQSGCSGARDPALPLVRTSTPQTHTLNFDDCAMQSGGIVPSTLPRRRPYCRCAYRCDSGVEGPEKLEVDAGRGGVEGDGC